MRVGASSSSTVLPRSSVNDQPPSAAAGVGAGAVVAAGADAHGHAQGQEAAEEAARGAVQRNSLG